MTTRLHASREVVFRSRERPEVREQGLGTWVCLNMLCTPKNPMVNDHYPVLNGYFIGGIPNIFRHTPHEDLKSHGRKFLGAGRISACLSQEAEGFRNFFNT